MSLASLLTQQVDIVTIGKTGTDQYNNPVTGEISRATVAARLTQKTATLLVDGRETLIDTWLLMLGPDATITGRDRIEYAGDTFTIVGEPKQARSPRGVQHVEAQLEKLEEQGT